MAESTRIGYREFYRKYPYKCQETRNGNTVVLPYIKQEEQDCNSPYSLPFKTWKAILETYLSLYCEALMEGHVLSLGARLGHLQLGHTKSWTGVDWEKYHSTGEVKPHYNRHTNNKKPFMKWHKGTFKGKNLWAVQLTMSNYKKLLNKIKKDANQILKLG